MANKAKRRRMSALNEDHKMIEKLKSPPAEVYDPDDVKLQKIDQLTEIFKSGKNIVIITGAGISTAASIPDYRGVNGLYTKDVDQFDRGFDIRTTVPTISHMVIKELLRNGFANHLISQNCDGLHLRSGISQKYISEVHGNMYIEFCTRCHGQFIRSYEVSFNSNFRQHETGRKCSCKYPLLDTIVHAGEKSVTIWPQNWDRAIEEVKQADVILIIGTSGVVLKNYASLWPEHATKILVNTQPTMIDDRVSWKIGAKSDEVLSRLAQNLGIESGLEYCRNCDFVLNHNPSRALIMTKFVMCKCHLQPPQKEFVLSQETANLGCPGWLKNGLKRMRKMYIYPDEKDDDDFNELTDNDDSWSPKNRQRTVSTTKNCQTPVKKRTSSKRNLKSVLEGSTSEPQNEEGPAQKTSSPSTSKKSPPKKRGRKKKFVRRVGRPPRSRSRSVDVEISSLADDHEDITSIQNHVNSDDNMEPILRQEIKVEGPLLSLSPPPIDSPQPTPQPTNFGRVLSERVSQRRRTPPPPHYGIEENNPRQNNPIPGVRNLLAAFEGNDLPSAEDILNRSPRLPEHMALSLNSLRRGVVEQRENGGNPEHERIAYNALANGYEQAFARQQDRIVNVAAPQVPEMAAAQENVNRIPQPVIHQNFHIDNADPAVEVDIQMNEARENLETQEQRDMEYLRRHDITPPAVLDDALRRHLLTRRRQQHEDFLRERELNPALHDPDEEAEINFIFNQQIQDEIEEMPLLGDRPALRLAADFLIADRSTPPGFLNELNDPEDLEIYEAPPSPYVAPFPEPFRLEEPEEEIIEANQQMENPVPVPVPQNEQVQEAMEVVENEAIVEDNVQNNQQVVVENHNDNIQEETPRIVRLEQNNQIRNPLPISVVNVPHQPNVIVPQPQYLAVRRNITRYVPIQPRIVAPIQRRQREQLEYAEMNNVSHHIEVVRHAVEPDFDENFLEGDDEPVVQVEQNPQRQPFREDLIPFPEDFLEPQFVDEPTEYVDQSEYSDQPSTSAASENPSYAVLGSASSSQLSTFGNFQYNEFSADLHPKVIVSGRTYQQKAQRKQNFAQSHNSYYYQEREEGQSSSSQPSSSVESPLNTPFVFKPKPKPKSRSKPKTFLNYSRLEDYPILEPEERAAAHQQNFDDIMSIVFNSYGVSLQVDKEEFARFQDMFMQRFGRSTGDLQLSQIRQMLRLFKVEHCKKT